MPEKPLLIATDLPLGAADKAALVAVQVDGVRLDEEKVLVSLIKENGIKTLYSLLKTIFFNLWNFRGVPSVVEPGCNYLRDEADGAVLEVEDGGGVPVLGGVHVALRGGRHDEVPVAKRRLDYPVTELELLPGVVCHVSQGDALPSCRCI